MSAFQLHRSQQVASWGALLRRLATCRALDLLRKRQPCQPLSADAPASVLAQPESVAVASELTQRLRRALLEAGPARGGGLFAAVFRGDDERADCGRVGNDNRYRGGRSAQGQSAAAGTIADRGGIAMSTTTSSQGFEDLEGVLRLAVEQIVAAPAARRACRAIDRAGGQVGAADAFAAPVNHMSWLYVAVGGGVVALCAAGCLDCQRLVPQDLPEEQPIVGPHQPSETAPQESRLSEVPPLPGPTELATNDGADSCRRVPKQGTPPQAFGGTPAPGRSGWQAVLRAQAPRGACPSRRRRPFSSQPAGRIRSSSAPSRRLQAKRSCTSGTGARATRAAPSTLPAPRPSPSRLTANGL